LKQAGHRCQHLTSADALIRAVCASHLDALLLAWSLVRFGGVDVVRLIRRSHRPSLPILVSGPDREADVVSALRQGADDYLVKPARRLQMVARIEAIARRATLNHSARTIEVGPIRVDYQTRSVLYGERPVNITGKEFDLLVLFLRNPGRVLSRSHLLESVWGTKARVTSRALDTRIYRLRKKLCLTPEYALHLRPAYGHGYRLACVDAASMNLRFNRVSARQNGESRPAPAVRARQGEPPSHTGTR
jgi:DNA-binding response OmpR family regulator